MRESIINFKEADTFRELLKITSIENFFNVYWKSRYLHVKGSEDDYDHILNWNKFNQILKNRDLSPHLNFFYKGTSILPQSISNGEQTRNGTPRIDLSQALTFSEGGATTVVQEIQNMNGIIGDLANNLSKDFFEFVNINAYYSSKNIHGFNLHTDSHETIILQIEEKKEWTILGAESTLPLSSQQISRNKDIDVADKQTLTLEKGDFLYVPRGVWHKAIAKEPSLHLTISIKCKYNYGIVHDFTRQLMNLKYFRENLRSSNPVPSKLSKVKIFEILDRLKKEIDIYKDSDELETKLYEINNKEKVKQKFNFPYYQ